MTGPRQLLSSYRARLLGGYVLVAVVIASAWLWWLFGPLKTTVIRQQERNLTAVAQAASIVASDSAATPEDLARQLVARTNLRITIVAKNGRVLADTQADPATMANHLNRPEIRAAFSGEVGTAERVSATLGTPELYVAVPAMLGGKPVAVRVAQPLTEIEALAAGSRRLGVILLVAAFGIALFIAARESHAVAAPIRALSGAAGAMAAGNLSVAIPEVPSDLEALAVALGELKGQIRDRIEELESEQLTLRTALDGLQDAVFLVEAGEIRFANVEASQLFPASGAWRGQPLDSPGLPSPLVAAAVELSTADSPSSVELAPDPLGRTLRLTVVPLTPTERGERALLVIADVTDRTRLDRVRRDFVANASHELKTPVAGIQLLAESAETAAEDGDVDQAIDFARQIAAESNRMRRLVTDLLDLSRLESAPAPDSVVDVRKVALNAVTGHRAAAQRKGIALSVDDAMVRGEDVYASVDPTDLAIMIDNLVDNGIAYTEHGSVVLSINALTERVVIRVTDTGIGIPAKDLQRIFERFYRVDRARSRDSGGTGLGLALVKHVVERSGGTVSATSEEGRGSTFTVSLPRAL